ELSGGERNRLHLAKILKRGANLILLDEPTNDLDVDTLRALEDALVDFAGCALVITHDRWFLDRIATHILAFEDEGRVVWSEGSYADYEADRRKRLGVEAERPHRLKYKRLPRACAGAGSTPARSRRQGARAAGAPPRRAGGAPRRDRDRRRGR